VRALRGFRRVTLPPGKAEDVKFTLDAGDLALLDEKLERVVEPGAFTLFVGGSSDTSNQASFEVTAGLALRGPGSAIPREVR
jgi:beta-glucosidase